jgi:hypothetical protein
MDFRLELRFSRNLFGPRAEAGLPPLPAIPRSCVFRQRNELINQKIRINERRTLQGKGMNGMNNLI